MATSTKSSEQQQVVCDVCKCTLASDKNLKEHTMGKKHQLAVHTAHVSQIKEKSSVFITGFPHLLVKKNIVEYLETFGKVVETFIGTSNKFVIVQFKDPKVAETLLKSNLSYCGMKLIVKPRKLRGQTEKHVEIDESQESFDTLLELLKPITSFGQQLEVVLSTMQLPHNEKVPKYIQLCDDLKAALHEVFPGCNVYPFGSTVTGLDFKSSDVDAYVDYNVPYSPLLVEPRAAAYVKIAKKALWKNRKFNNVVGIPKAKTPIVKCVHVPTKICCDFNFKNMLGVCNSKLIGYYMGLDPKLKPVMVVLKCWAKMQDLIGTSGKLSSYSLTMMFIFYLQQPMFNLPSVKALQSFVQYPNFQDDWNGNFNNSFQVDSVLLKSSSHSSLLHGFFKFYENFNYSLHIISPFIGKPLLKIDFLKTLELPNTFALYKLNVLNLGKDPLMVETPVCLQDPFEQNHNTTRGMSMKLLEEFIGLCKHGSTIMDDPKENPSLYKLFTEEGYERKYKCTDKLCEFKINMGSSLMYLESKIPANTTDKSKELSKLWFEEVNEFIITSLLRVFKFEVTICKKDTTKTKSKKLDGQNDVHHNEPVDEVKFHCIGKQNLWETRKTIMRDIVFEENIKTTMEKQVFVTDYISNKLLDGMKFTEPIIDFHLTMQAMMNPIRMEFIMEKNACVKNEFRTLSSFFAMKMPHFFDMHEKEKNYLEKTKNEEASQQINNSKTETKTENKS